MKVKAILILFALLFVSLPLLPGESLDSNKEIPKSGDFQSDFRIFLKWFEGEFDNFEQFKEDEYNKVDPPHQHLHSIFTAIKAPAVGEHIFFVTQYKDGDPSKVYRRRLYSFVPKEREKRIELHVFAFKNEQEFKDASWDRELLSGVTMEQLKSFPGCEVLFQLKGDRFESIDKEKGCTFKSSRTGKTLIIKEKIVLFENAIHILEDIRDETGGPVYGRKDGIPNILRKCRFFKGWAVVEDKETKKYHVIRNLRLHDQGQKMPLITKDGVDTGFLVELAQLTYSKSNTRVLKLAVYEKGNKKSKFYIWGEPNAQRLGINMRWFQTGFTLENPDKP